MDSYCSTDFCSVGWFAFLCVRTVLGKESLAWLEEWYACLVVLGYTKHFHMIIWLDSWQPLRQESIKHFTPRKAYWGVYNLNHLTQYLGVRIPSTVPRCCSLSNQVLAPKWPETWTDKLGHGFSLFASCLPSPEWDTIWKHLHLFLLWNHSIGLKIF